MLGPVWDYAWVGFLSAPTRQDAYLAELGKIKHETDWLAFLLIVSTNSYKCVLVWQCPTVHCDMDKALDILRSMSVC